MRTKTSAEGGNRTLIPVGNTILSRARLPIPPLRLVGQIANLPYAPQSIPLPTRRSSKISEVQTKVWKKIFSRRFHGEKENLYSSNICRLALTCSPHEWYCTTNTNHGDTEARSFFLCFSQCLRVSVVQKAKNKG